MQARLTLLHDATHQIKFLLLQENRQAMLISISSNYVPTSLLFKKLFHDLTNIRKKVSSYKGHWDITRIIRNIVLVNLGFHIQKNFPENYLQYGHAPTKFHPGLSYAKKFKEYWCPEVSNFSPAWGAYILWARPGCWNINCKCQCTLLVMPVLTPWHQVMSIKMPLVFILKKKLQCCFVLW